MSQWIKLRCPSCKREVEAERQPFDPPNAVVAEICCPGCATGDFSEDFYFDAHGKEIQCPPYPPETP